MYPTISHVASAFPPHYYPQEALTAFLSEHFWEGNRRNIGRLQKLHENVQVRGRYLALPPEEYASLHDFSQSNEAWIRVASELAEEVATRALGERNLEPAAVSLLATTTVTGIAVPTLDARLMNRLPFNPATKRLPLFGLGCLGGVAGVARTADYLQGHPEEAALLLAVELCSLTFQRDDLSIANIIATGLFGDGAAAVLMAGAEHPLSNHSPVEIVASRATFFPDTERVMGWDVTSGGFQVVLSADVPAIAREQLRPAVDAFLSDHGLCRAEVARWVAHPGGPKVIEGLSEGLELPDEALALSRESLNSVGILWSASVLLILKETLRRTPPPAPGSFGLMLAMGPGFCAEMVLLRWRDTGDDGRGNFSHAAYG